MTVKQNGFSSTNWMQQNIDLLGDKELAEICITGSHDSGMSEIVGATIGSFPCNTQTQSFNIYDQLNFGTRYFDIRPILRKGKYRTGHYTDVLDKSTQGAAGRSIKKIIEDINQFTAEQNELVILNLSHSRNTDFENDSVLTVYPSFTQDQWNELFELLSDGLNHLYINPTNEGKPDLIQLTLNDFIQDNKAAVVIIVEDGTIDLTTYKGQGFFHAKESFNVYNKYSNTKSIGKMVDDQIDKMEEQRAKGRYFLLSWTLTQADYQALSCGVDPLVDSILDLSKKALKRLDNEVINIKEKARAGVFPNIIYTDNIINDFSAELAMLINNILFGKKNLLYKVCLKNKANGEYRNSHATEMQDKYEAPDCVFYIEPQDDEYVALRNKKNEKYLDSSISTMSSSVKNSSQKWELIIHNEDKNEYWIRNKKNGEYLTKKASQLSSHQGSAEIYILESVI